MIFEMAPALSVGTRWCWISLTVIPPAYQAWWFTRIQTEPGGAGP